ncbi:MAG TPA: DUF502 domain-containing protein [Hyphomonadaceae bacterium]|jgi:uncharacterized membrane protein|nr:DUF502 domain-containing protein [Hyphomonadaceae bacterium]
MSLAKKTREAVRSSRRKALATLRNWFFTGIVVSAPIGITIWLVWSVVAFVDQNIKPLIPPEWNPETYLKFALPGFGIVVAVVWLTLLGALTANLIGRSLINFGERVLARVPLVRSIYSAVKQVFETFASSEASSFKEAVLIEFPGPGLWAIGFITSKSPGAEITATVPDAIGVMIPTSPNPAMGHLCYVTPDKIRKLDMSIDKAAKLVISFGVLSSEQLSQELGANKPAPQIVP